MSHVRHGLLNSGRASRTEITEINKLIWRAIKYMHFKNSNENVISIKISKIKFICWKHNLVWVRILHVQIQKRCIASKLQSLLSKYKQN